MEKKKLSLSEFLRILQLEYLTYKVRSLIFDKAEIIKFNLDIARMKKEKILGLQKKFHIATIFDSLESFMNFYNNEFLNKDTNSCNMQYSLDEKKKEAQEKWDRIGLYKAGTKVIYQNQECLVFRNLQFKKHVVLSYNNRLVDTVPYDKIKIKDLVTAFDGRLM